MSDASQEMSKPRTRRRPRPNSFSNDERSDRGELLENLTNALSTAKKSQIDMLLERQQLDFAPLPNEDKNAPPSASRRLPTMSDEEMAKAYADVYGRPPPDVARSEERLAAVEREARRLPPGQERDALTKAMVEYPLLFVSCSHTKMILEQDDNKGEGESSSFDASLAARRMARYWDRRRSLLGDKACYAPGTFPTHTLWAYKRLYDRKVALASDPEADDEAREMAKESLRIMHDIKVQALTNVLEQEHRHEREREASSSAEHREHLLLSLQAPDELKLQFLRAEDFIERKAAQRMVRYWKLGLHLFGPTFRRRTVVTLDDLDDCSELFRLRLVRLMPREDDCGRSVLVYRRIIAIDGVREEEESDDFLPLSELVSRGIGPDQYAKVGWYMFQATLERESCQKNGLVALVNTIKTSEASGDYNDIDLYRQAHASIVSCFPAKVRAIHFLFGPNQAWWRRLLGTIYYTVGKTLRGRFFVHTCAEAETVAELGREFGLAKDNLPADLGGTLGGEIFDQWVLDRRAAGL